MTQIAINDIYNPAGDDQRCSACARIPWDPKIWDLLARYNRLKVTTGSTASIGPFHHRSQCELDARQRALAMLVPGAAEAEDRFHQHSDCHDDIEYARTCMQSERTLGNGDVELFWRDSLSEKRFEYAYTEGLGGLREVEAEYLRSLLDETSSTNGGGISDRRLDGYGGIHSSQGSEWGHLLRYFEENPATTSNNSDSVSAFPDDHETNGKMILYFDHHRNFDALTRAAATGCNLCRTFRTLMHSRWLTDSPSSEAQCVVKIVLSDDPETPGYVKIGFSRLAEGRVSLRRVSSWAAQGKGRLQNQRAWKGVEDEGLQRVVTEVINPWIQSCDIGHELHKHCRQDRTKQGQEHLPTRLIDVGKDSNRTVRLVQTKDSKLPAPNTENLKYTILSYCWGNSNESAKTTRSNLHERLDELDPKSLPQTIQDAMRLTRAMGIRYLWVDALCIIQRHDEDAYLEDFFLEAPKMGSYYSNAYCLISALAAADSSQGLFTSGEIGRHDTKPRMIGYSKFDDAAWVVENMPEKIEAEARIHTPAMERGWCLQERLLSPRILHWTTAGVFWQCRGTEASELRPEAKALCSLQNTSSLTRDYDGIVAEPVKERATGGLWTRLVKTYQLMQLGQEIDRLNAIQGLGNRLAEVHGDEYFAGIFVSQAAQGLLWQGEKRKEAHGSESFPTWSWGAASFSSFTDPDVSLIQEIYTPAAQTEFPQATLGYHGLRGGREMRKLRLRAPLIDMVGLELSGNGLNKTATWKHRNMKLELHFDEKGLVPNDSHMLQILLLGYMKGFNPIVGIVVRHNEADLQCHERIGYAVVRTGEAEGSIECLLQRYMTSVNLI